MTIEALYAAVGGDYQATLRRLMVPEIVETFGAWPRTWAFPDYIKPPPC